MINRLYFIEDQELCESTFLVSFDDIDCVSSYIKNIEEVLRAKNFEVITEAPYLNIRIFYIVAKEKTSVVLNIKRDLGFSEVLGKENNRPYGEGFWVNSDEISQKKGALLIDVRVIEENSEKKKKSMTYVSVRYISESEKTRVIKHNIF